MDNNRIEDPRQGYYFSFLALAALSLAVAHNFLRLFFLSFLCFLDPATALVTPALINLYFGSNSRKVSVLNEQE